MLIYEVIIVYNYDFCLGMLNHDLVKQFLNHIKKYIFLTVANHPPPVHPYIMDLSLCSQQNMNLFSKKISYKTVVLITIATKNMTSKFEVRSTM